MLKLFFYKINCSLNIIELFPCTQISKRAKHLLLLVTMFSYFYLFFVCLVTPGGNQRLLKFLLKLHLADSKMLYDMGDQTQDDVLTKQML